MNGRLNDKLQRYPNRTVTVRVHFTAELVPWAEVKGANEWWSLEIGRQIEDAVGINPATMEMDVDWQRVKLPGAVKRRLVVKMDKVARFAFLGGVA